MPVHRSGASIGKMDCIGALNSITSQVIAKATTMNSSGVVKSGTQAVRAAATINDPATTGYQPKRAARSPPVHPPMMTASPVAASGPAASAGGSPNDRVRYKGNQPGTETSTEVPAALIDPIKLNSILD